MTTSTLVRPDARRPSGPADGTDVSTSVGKALALLNTFSNGTSGVLGVSEIARRAGVAKSTAYRLLCILESHGLVEREGDRWLLGAQLFRLGNLVPVCRPRKLRDRALPHMQDLYEATHATIQLAVPHGHQVLYLEKIYGHNHLDSPSTVGGLMPMYCTAVGKAMLSRADAQTVAEVVAGGLTPLTPRTITDPTRLANELATARRTGYAVDRQEARLGLTCVGAPILEHGVVTGALSLSVPAGRLVPDRSVEAVRHAAQLISRP
ncbi:IclR family transcriptional regulator [Solwaraspora sp. WMMD1047]|uniref:IclR family transcriptional regulator n=1 Tax=Solwaraspora sp. WMMD1047 TaxID=3016102 RepID=UPI002417AF10|nr:IclR family transcriptional regulator [Solwaraspora sp. WMMD1047]MDG4834306.1 IclR family transcriptional regulator [Solwaraspora sp. WMMD1047]